MSPELREALLRSLSTSDQVQAEYREFLRSTIKKASQELADESGSTTEAVLLDMIGSVKSMNRRLEEIKARPMAKRDQAFLALCHEHAGWVEMQTTCGQDVLESMLCELVLNSNEKETNDG